MFQRGRNVGRVRLVIYILSWENVVLLKQKKTEGEAVNKDRILYFSHVQETRDLLLVLKNQTKPYTPPPPPRNFN